MNLACLNTRGLNLAHKREEVRALVLDNKVSLLGLVKTRVRYSNFSSISRSLLKGWKVLANYNHHHNGRIWVLWDPNIVDVCLLFSSSQVIHVSVMVLEKQINFLASFTYAFKSYIDHIPLWELIRLATPTMEAPLTILEDFNVVRFPHEKVGGSFLAILYGGL